MKSRKVGVGTFSSTPKMKEMVCQVLDSNRLSYGPFCREFEGRLARLHGCKLGVLSNSGTSALHVALQALKEVHGWGDGTEVIVPAVAFVADVNIVLHNNMTPVIAGVEAGTYALDPAWVEMKITNRTRAILPVHPFGQPADMKSLTQIARRHNLKIIEDSCECIGAEHEGKMVGQWGDITCFSTYIAHIISTGVGGMSITNNEDYAIRMRSLVNHGRNNIYINIDDNNPDRLAEVIGRRFNFPHVGHSFRITELEAAIGLEQLDRLDEILAQRTYIACQLRSMIADSFPSLTTLRRRYATSNSWMMFPIITRERDKVELVQYLEEHGVETRDALPLINQPAYSYWMKDAKHYPVAKLLLDSGFYIGCHQDMTKEDVDYIGEVLSGYYKSR